LTASTLKLDLSADALVRRLLALDPARGLALLDSCGVSVSGGQYLVAGIDPYEVLTARDGKITRRTELNDVETADGDILGLLDQRLGERGGGEQWAGGCIATFSYEFGRRFEVAHSLKDKLGAAEPDVEFAFYDALALHDYSKGESFIGAQTAQRAEELRDTLTNAEERGFASPTAPARFTSNFTRDDYERAVERIKEYIAAGDIYQANLTQQLTVPIGDAAAEEIFLRLREQHPAPFAAFIRRTDDTVISASPERFLRVGRDRRVEAWPIKGTRPRGADEAADAALRAALLDSAKDRAENVMIVDLLRNDLGRVCETGSVEVAELFTLQEHPSLFHLVSKVRGILRGEVGMGELMRAAFPCGSITGAPKIRAMQIIDELEPDPRGLSMGAIGFIGFDDSADLSVAIRTMTIRDGVARFNVGGGIVADSDPAAEYEESLVKARALLAALSS
jgi:para-aminobenzoate synthetase component 1